MLAAMGALLELKADLPNSEALQDLKPLVTARQALIRDRTAAKARFATTIARQCIANAMSREGAHSLLSRQIKRRLKQIERDLCQAADEIDVIVAADEGLAARAAMLTSMSSASPRSQPVQF